MEPYNPIVRLFGQYRAALCAAEGLPRRSVTANAPLESLIPEARRRAVWASIRRAGLRTPALELSRSLRWSFALPTVAALMVLMNWTGDWWPALLALAPIWYAAYRVSRPWAVHFPSYVRTVGELAVYGTQFGDHATSGYRWSHGDIMLKVRMILAEQLGLPLEKVRPESSFAELGCY